MNFSYKTIITDVDGTLYFQKPMRIKMGSLLLLHPITALKVMSFRKKHEQGKIENPDKDIRRFMYELPLKYIFEFRDNALAKVLERFYKNGGKVIAYSDHPAKEKIAALKIECDGIYDPTVDGINSLKPNPEGLKLIIEKEGLDISECLFIGDREEKDGLCAKAVGMDYLILSKNRTTRKQQIIESFPDYV